MVPSGCPTIGFWFGPVCVSRQVHICHFLGKGWHCSVILAFLNDMCLRDDVNVDPLVSATVWCAHNFMGLLYQNREEYGIWMDADDIQQLVLVGDRLLNHLLEANTKYRNFCAYKLFSIRPQVHQFDQLLALQKNPPTSATWMGEDGIRAVMCIAKKCRKNPASFSSCCRKDLSNCWHPPNDGLLTGSCCHVVTCMVVYGFHSFHLFMTAPWVTCLFFMGHFLHDMSCGYMCMAVMLFPWFTCVHVLQELQVLFFMGHVHEVWFNCKFVGFHMLCGFFSVRNAMILDFAACLEKRLRCNFSASQLESEESNKENTNW